MPTEEPVNDGGDPNVERVERRASGPPWQASALRVARRHTEALAIGALLLAVVAFAMIDGVPLPILGLGVVGGATVALHACGIVLVYRTNHIVNFAQIQLGSVAGLVFVNLVNYRSFIRGIAKVCPPCLPSPATIGDVQALGGSARLEQLLGDPLFRSSFPPSTRLTEPRLLPYLPDGFSATDFALDVAPSWLVYLNYALAAVISVALATLLLWLLYSGVIRRFSHAPRLVLTVITIAVGHFAQQVSEPVVGFLFDPDSSGAPVVDSTAARLPISAERSWGPVVFTAADLLTLVAAIAAAAALAYFFRRNRAGIVLRGAAENPLRAETLGVNVGSVTARVWVVAGLLSGAAAVLAVARTGAAPDAEGFDTFVRVLAGAIAGGLVALPLAVVGSFVVGITDQVAAWSFGSQAPVAGILLAVIVLLLLAQRARQTRADREAASSWKASREVRPIPGALRDVPAVRNVIRALVIAGALIVLGYPWFMSPAQTNGGIVTMIQAMIGLSLLILTGWAGQISLGQMAFAAVGAYVAAVLRWPFLLSLLAGGGAGAALAFVVGVPSLRLRGLHLAVTTLAFGLAVSALVLGPNLGGRNLPTSIGRPVILGMSFEDERAFYYLTLVLLVVVVAAVVGLRRSGVARVLIATKDNEQTATSFGVSLVRARLTAFALSGCLAGFAGALFAYAQHGVDSEAFSPVTSISVFLMTLIGGLGSVAGPLVGALYLGLLRVGASTVFAPLTNVLLNPGLGVLLLFLVLPGGIVQGVAMARDAWLRRVAIRNRIHVPSLTSADVAGEEEWPIAPNLRPSGGESFVPRRFRMERQWLVESRRAERERAREKANTRD